MPAHITDSSPLMRFVNLSVSDYRKSIFSQSPRERFEILQLISHSRRMREKMLHLCDKNRQSAKRMKEEKILFSNRKFCLLFYQLHISDFECLYLFIVHEGLKRKGSGANPLNHYFRYLNSPCDADFTFATMATNSPLKTFKRGTQSSQVPNNYETLHGRLIQFMVYWNLIYHLKREQSRQQTTRDFCAIVQNVPAGGS